MIQSLLLPAVIKNYVETMLESSGYEKVRRKDFKQGVKQYSIVSNQHGMKLYLNDKEPLNAYCGVLINVLAALEDDRKAIISQNKKMSAATTEIAALHDELAAEVNKSKEMLTRLESEIKAEREHVKRYKSTVAKEFEKMVKECNRWPGKRGNDFRKLLKVSQTRINNV
jgi:uncharacterized protein YukE